MYKYQIVEVKEKFQHAGSKAREDATFFAEEYGFTPIYINCPPLENFSLKTKIVRQLKIFSNWTIAFLKIKNHSVIFIQNPFYHRQLGRDSYLKLLKSIKKCKIVSLIHDVERLRGDMWGEDNNHEFMFMLKNSDYFIVHNDIMKEYFATALNVTPERLVSLEIFDYNFNSKKANTSCPSAELVLAGNLGKKKSVYIYMLKKLNDGLKINLYGPNYEDDSENDNVKYLGSFPPDEVPNVLNGKFGLIWDGDSLDCCSGQTGNYLRYNNPHKTSLYIVSGIPIVIWKEAAMARFVEKENIGITINSLSEIKEKINALSDTEYAIMKENTYKISEKLKSGYYLKTALTECENRICKG